MTMADSAFDRNLDRILAARIDPAVPPDLARRIVVRTAIMPQSERRDAAARPPARKSGRNFPVRVFNWTGLPAGVAIAASLLLFLSWPNLSDLPASRPEMPTGGPHLASADDIAAKVDLPAAAPVRAPNPEHAIPTSSPPPKVEIARAAPAIKVFPIGDGDEKRPAFPIKDDDPTMEIVAGYAGSIPYHPTVNDFMLAEQGEEARPVYGPVLHPETRGSHSSPPVRSSISGLAIAP